MQPRPSGHRGPQAVEAVEAIEAAEADEDGTANELPRTVVAVDGGEARGAVEAIVVLEAVQAIGSH